MATWLRDEGDVSVFLDDAGQEVRVAKSHAEPYMPPSMGGEIAPAGAIDEAAPPAPSPVPDLPLPGPPEPQDTPSAPGFAAWADMNAAANPLPAPAPAPQPSPSGPPAGAGAGLSSLGAPPPEPAGPPGAVLDMPPDPVPPPSILPERVAKTPTALAGQVNAAAQEQADSAHRLGQARQGAAEQIVQGSEALDTRLAELEEQQRVYREERDKQERLLSDDYQKKVERYAGWKADPTRGISSDRMAWAWVATALAGLGAALKGEGGKNPALEALMANLDRNVQRQMAERDALGQSIGMQRDAITDFRSATKTRMGEYDLRMSGELERYARLVDRVKTRLGGEADREAATQLSAQLRAEASQRLSAAWRTEADMRARAAAARAAAIQKARKEAEERARFMAKEKVRWDERTQSYVPDERFAGPQTLEGREQLAKTTKAEADAAKAVLEGSPEERTRILGVGGIENKAGQPLLAGTPEEAVKFRQGKANVDMAAQLLDKLIAARDKYGWSSDLLKSPEWRTMQSDFAQLQLVKKGQGMDELGVLTGPDVEMIGRSLGTSDPTELREVAKGLENARANIVNQYNFKLKSLDPNAERYEPIKAAVRERAEAPQTDNLGVAFAPLSDLAKADADERVKQLEARRLAYEEVARQGDSVDTLKLAARKLQTQHAAGEVDDRTYQQLLSKLAASAYRLQAEEAYSAGPGGMGAVNKNGPTSGKGWEERLLLGKGAK